MNLSNMSVPFYDLSSEYKLIKKDIQNAVDKVISSQQYILGSELSSFEDEFATYLGVHHCVGVGSGTDGLLLALLALDIKKGDEVITQANSFIATAYAISLVGASPVLIDVDPKTHQMDITKLEKLITRKTKVIIPVHLFGSPAPIKEIIKIAKKNKVKVIEDACQAHGGRYDEKKLGSFGDLSVFSFYPSKNLGAYGDGGAVCTNSKSMYEKLLLLRNYGQRKKYVHETFGRNSRLDEIQAAVLRVKLTHLDAFVKERNKIAMYYRSNLKNVKYPEVVKDGSSAYHLFVITHKKRDSLQRMLSNKGIGTLIHYPIPIHLQKVYTSLRKSNGSYPVSEMLAKTSLSLPFFFGISKKQLEYVVSSINSFSSV